MFPATRGFAAWVAACAGFLALATAAAAATPMAAPAGPRPLTDAERQGVLLAAEYQAGGAAAWWPRLARGSWLRGLGREAAIAEIAVRAGEPAGSHWTLQAAPADFAARGAAFTIELASGADDTLLVKLAEEGGALAIDDLRVAAEPGAGGGAAGLETQTAGAGAGGGAGLPGGRLGILLAMLLGAAGLAALVAARRLAGRRGRQQATPARVLGRISPVMVRQERSPGARALAATGIGLLAFCAVELGAMGRRGELGAWFPRGGGAMSGGTASRGELGGGVARDQSGGGAARGESGAGAISGGADSGAGAGLQAPPEHLQLRALLPLRRALTATLAPPAAPSAAGNGGVPAMGEAPPGTGATAAVAAPVVSAASVASVAPGADPAAREVERVGLLWRAQQRLGSGDLAGAETMLRGVPVPAREPLAELLRARLALLRLEPVATGVAYERALGVGVAHEGLLLEAVEALYILGFEDTAKRYLQELAALGARGAETYYDIADLALLDDQKVVAHQNFRIAWRLQPIARADLLGQSLSSFMLQDRDLRRMMSLGSFAEPLGACGGGSGRALGLPPGVSAHLLGEVLRLSAGSAEVRVPGGCELAPAGTPQVGAATWKEEREAAALARLPELRRAAGSAGALAQPALRRQTEEAAVSLAERQRWPEVLAITEGLAQPSSILPPLLVRLRAAALARQDRPTEARQLLVRLALRDKASRRADPGALYQLARLLEQAGEFDQAIRLVAKANSELPSPPGGDRILQLQMEKRLAASMERFTSPHFLVSYPLSRGPAFAQETARVLEAERLRLLQWIPLPPGGGARIEVRLLPFQDFELAYSQSGEVLGLYDGVVRVPLGNLRTFNPFAVALMTHELAHAMIAQRTADRAPHWFHEGLAQHVEMHEEPRVNPIADYRSTERLLAFPLLEPALQSFSSAVWVTASYEEALWTLNYVESRYGVAGIHRLMDAFRAGQTTPEALASALGTPAARFDQDLWAWCADRAPRSWRLETVRYDGGEANPRRF